MYTLAELRARVRIEIGESAEGYWTDAQLNGYVNDAAVSFSADTGLLLAPPRSADSTAGYALYTLPEDCPGPQAVVAVFYAGTELEPTAPAALMRQGKLPHSDTGVPASWYTVAEGGEPCLALYPIPASGLASGIVVWFWKTSAPMSTEDAACEIPAEHVQGVVYGAAERAFLARREQTQAEACRRLYNDEVARARSAADSLLAASLSQRGASPEKVRTIF
ncbi:MAG: hypothetical protein JW909_13095 [Planctomycetes bacterium]|nr:hypothetical protein [Planctomycetota bacterium]